VANNGHRHPSRHTSQPRLLIASLSGDKRRAYRLHPDDNHALR
jgi:hypothetical protein